MLRDYQQKAITDIGQALRAGNRTVGLMLPTGSGKTRIAEKIILALIARGKKVLFICDRIELINQTSACFDTAEIEHGVMQANHERFMPSKSVQVCSIQTLARRQIPDADYIIVDEFHTIFKTQLKMIESMCDTRFIGLSATPFTRGLGKYWEKLVVGARTQELIDAGYLSPFEIYGPPPPDLRKVKMQAGDYNQKQLGKKVDQPKVIGEIVSTWLKHGEDRQTICFAINIEHSKHIVNSFMDSDIPAAHIDCFTEADERKEIHRQFRAKEIAIISSVDVLTKGYDCPIASCLIMSRPTKSLTVYIQQFGRILRICEGKENAIVLDHGGNAARHGFPTDPLPEILCNDDRNAKKAVKREKLPKTCPKCHYLKYPGISVCPKCGFETQHINTVENTDDKLVKIDKIPMNEKQNWYAMLLYIARLKHYADGWASHKYKMKFGVWPHKKTGVHPIPPSKEVDNYLKYIYIKGRHDMANERIT